MLVKMVIFNTVHAVVQAIVNIEEKNEDNFVELSIEPAVCKYVFKTLIWLKKTLMIQSDDTIL